MLIVSVGPACVGQVRGSGDPRFTSAQLLDSGPARHLSAEAMCRKASLWLGKEDSAPLLGVGKDGRMDPPFQQALPFQQAPAPTLKLGSPGPEAAAPFSGVLQGDTVAVLPSPGAVGTHS